MLSLIIFIIGFAIADIIPTESSGLMKIEYLTENNNIFFVFLVPFAVVLAHELMHAAAYKIFGAKLKFGYKHFSIYLTDISGTLFTLQQMTIIMLFPLVSLTAITIIVANILQQRLFLFLLAILINVAGSIGDILLLTYILFKGRACRVKDEKNGFSLYKANTQSSS